MFSCSIIGVVIVSFIHIFITVSGECNHGELLPNLIDCQLYYHCSHATLHERSCPAGLHFNPRISVCDWPWNVKCEPESSTITTADSTTQAEAAPDSTTKTMECNHGELLPHSIDCQLYYQCSHATFYEIRCPEGLYFNPSISVCDWPSNVYCEADQSLNLTTTIGMTAASTSITVSIKPNKTSIISSTLSFTRCTDFCGHYVGTLKATCPCPQFNLGMQWRNDGAIFGKHCIQITESADPDTWDDNYLCFNNDYGVRWSSGGAIEGMNCTRILETADPHTWDDNFLCVPNSSMFQFKWSSNGPILGLCCVQMIEPADPHTWSDNYICVQTPLI